MVDMENNQMPRIVCYFKGNKAQLTANSQVILGVPFSEVRMLEGPAKGEIRLVLANKVNFFQEAQ
jgi:hypothetical protein